MAETSTARGVGVEQVGRGVVGWLFWSISLALDWRKLLLAALAVHLMTLLVEAILPGFAPVAGVEPLLEWDLLEWTRLPAGAWSLAGVAWLPWRVLGAVFSVGEEAKFWPALLAYCGLLAISGLVGAAIARMTLVKVATGTSPGLLTAVKFAGRKVAPLMLAPLGVFGFVLFLGGILSLFGFLFRLGEGAGSLVVGVMLPLLLLVGLLMAWLVVALAAGWPLMVATVAAENDDTFDALSRSLSYLFQRPLKFVGYVLICGVAGVLGILLVALLYHLTMRMTSWGLALSAPEAIAGDPLGLKVVGQPGSTLIAMWTGLARLLARSWVFSFFWCATAQVYLLLRHDVDGTPLDDVDLPGDEGLAFAPEEAGMRTGGETAEVAKSEGQVG